MSTPEPVTGDGLRQLHAGLGVEATTLDPLEPGAGEILRAVLLEHGLVLLRGLALDAGGVVEVASRLGTVMRHPPHPSYPDLPEIAPIANEAESGRVSRPYWHTDGLLREDPPCVTVFYAAEVPPSGGDTLFADARAAFEDLDEDDRDLLAGLTAVLQTGTRCPLVRLHPVTGRRALAVNMGATTALEGVTHASAEQLMLDLASHLAEEERVYSHRYELGDLVLWDNWAVVHSATNVPPPPARRLMLRADVHAWVDYALASASVRGERPPGQAP